MTRHHPPAGARAGAAVETLAGEDLAPHLAAVTRLRAVVFRDWPYLYEASEGSEERYLRAYAGSPGAAVVLARVGGEVVGAATCQPLAEASPAVREGVAAGGLGTGETGYLGESVLLPEHRGRGLGVAFFEAREAHLRALGLRAAAFCAVRRDPDDPRRPPDHRPLDGFWRRRGYAPLPAAACRMAWREVGAEGEVGHALDVWWRRLA